jgi:hypothetical protein
MVDVKFLSMVVAYLATVPIAFEYLCSLLFPVVAVVRFPAAFPSRVVRASRCIVCHPQGVAFVGAKATVEGFGTALLARMRFYGLVCHAHAGSGAILRIMSHLTANLARVPLNHHVPSFLKAFLRAEFLVLGRLATLFTGTPLYESGGGTFLRAEQFVLTWDRPTTLRAWFLLIANGLLAPLLVCGLRVAGLACKLNITFVRTVFLKGWLSALQARREMACPSALCRAKAFLWPHKELPTHLAVSDFPLVQSATLVVTVFLEVWRKRLAAGYAMVLLQLTCLETRIRAELFGIAWKYLAAFLAAAKGTLVGFVARGIAELLAGFAEGLAAIEAVKGLYTFRHLAPLVVSSLGFETGHRSKIIGLSAGHESALAP